MFRFFASTTSLCVALNLTSITTAEAQSSSVAHSFRQIEAVCGRAVALQTGAQETVEAIATDGTSVVLAPGGAAKVSCGADGQLLVALERGLARVSGGLANGTIIITTPDATLQLVAGSAIIEVAGGTTRTHLLAGEGLRVSSGGDDRLIYRPGFQVMTTGSGLTAPRRVSRQQLVADFLALSNGLSSGTRPQISSGLGQDRGALPNDAPRQPTDRFVANDIPPPVDNRPDVKPTVPKPTVPKPTVEPTIQLGSLSGFGGLTPSIAGRVEDVNEKSTTTVDGSYVQVQQNYDDSRVAENDGLTERVNLGPTTNRLFQTSDLSPNISSSADLGGLILAVTERNPSGYPGYYYGITFEGGEPTIGIGELVQLKGGDDNGLVRFLDFGRGVVNAVSYYTIEDTGIISNATTFGPVPDDLFGETEIILNGGNTGVWYQGAGVILDGINYGTDYQRAQIDPVSTDVLAPLVRTDNFIFLDMKIVKALGWAGNNCEPKCFELFTQFSNDIGAINSNFDSGGGSFGTVLVNDPSENRRYIFATGGLDGVIKNETAAPAKHVGRFVDEFHLSAGMEGPITSGLENLSGGMYTDAGNRAFLRAETWTDLAKGRPGFNLSTADLIQSPLYVAYDGSSVLDDATRRPKFAYADFAVKEVKGKQVSTISATIGDVYFRVSNEPCSPACILGNNRSADAILSGRTIGSSRGLRANGSSAASILAYSNIQSTAAGGGNTNLGSNGVADPGRLGFFVLENTGKVFDDVAPGQKPLLGGVEAPLGTEDTTKFALLRLGVATGKTNLAAPALTFGAAMKGYAAAITETETHQGNVRLGALGAPDLQDRNNVAAALAPNLSFPGLTMANSNAFSATLAGIALGGGGGRSAIVGNDLYMARSSGTGSDLAMVSGKTVVAGTGALARGNPNNALAKTTAGYKHVQWGFFFGDTKTNGNREHAHLGTYVAAADLPASLRNLTTGSVTYRGHSVGTVVNGGNTYTASGTYRDTFDFGSRTGSIAMDFDGRNLKGTSDTLKPNSRYTGTLPYTGSVTGGGLVGELNGRFGGQKTLGGGAWAPSAVIGSFSMTGTPGGGAAGYTAIGTFAGETR